MRSPNPATDYTVAVDDHGQFVFGRRAIKDEVAIQAEFARLTEGAPLTPWLFRLCTWLAALKVLMVHAPEGFDLMGMDPLDEDTYATLEAVFNAMRDQEERFRGKSRKGRQEPGAGAGADDRLLVSPEVQPAAE